jgi:polar amino acid transport system permease protein
MANVFIEFFRGIPALVTIFGVGLIIPLAFGTKPMDSVAAGILALVLVTSAYTAEIIRSGIIAVPKGQTEAARSLGMPASTTTLWVVLPQAFRIVIPPLTNEFVLLLKDSSLLYILGTTPLTKELTTFGRDAVATYANSTSLVIAAILYLVMTVPLTYLVGILEKKLAVRK